MEPGHVVLPEGVRAVHGLQLAAAASVSTRGSRVRDRNHPPTQGPPGLRNIRPIRRLFVEEVVGVLYDGYVKAQPQATVEFLHYTVCGHVV
jgi:hypothetical protein